MWNVFDGLRTNNYVEGWHNKLNSFLGRRHPNIYQLMEFIKNEQANTSIELVQPQSGAMPPPKKKYIMLESRLNIIRENTSVGNWRWMNIC